MVLHGWHSNSPLSHPFLIRRAFFSDGYPESKLVEFRRLLNRYESLRWPMTMMYPFVDPRRLLGNISGWAKGDRLLVMAGTEDKLMTKDIVHDTAATYRAATADMISRGRLEGDNSPVHPIQEDSLGDSAGHGVRLAWVPGAGHHLQNDSQWRVGAEKLLSFLVQL